MMNLSAKSSVTGVWIVGGGTNITLQAWQTPESDVTVTAAGQLITGAVESITVTVKLHVAVLPDGSVATLVTVVVPRLNVLPDAGVLTTVALQLSVAVTLKLTTAPQLLLADATLILAGQVIVGGVVSLTVTVWVQVAVLPDASVAVHVTVVVPTGKHDGASLVMVAMLQLSLAAGTPAPTCIAAIASAGALLKPIATHEYCKLPFWVR